MSFLAKLKIDDEEYNILEFSFDVTQPTSQDGRTIGLPILGNIDILLESRSATEFYAWSLGKSYRKDGEIVFYKRDTVMAIARTLVFKAALCAYYKETFNSNSTNPMKTRLKLAAEIVNLDSTEHEVPWRNDY